MMMKRSYGTLAAILTALPLYLVAPVSGSAETIRVAGNFPVEHSSSQAMEIFRQELGTRSGGALTADLFPAMQLGGPQENVDQVRSGAVFATWIGIAYLSRTVPELEAVSLPFAFADRDAAFRVIDGKVGQLLENRLAEKGFQALGYMELGSRNVTNSVRPIRSLADFAGLKIRLQPNETHLATFKAIGASPVAMGIEEVYPALQQSVLDGQENPYSIIATRRFDEVQSYLSDSGHFFDFIVLIANKARFDSLPEDQQQALHEAAAVAVAWQRARAAEEDQAARAELIKRGMEFDPLPSETRAALRKATAGVVDTLKAKIGAEIIDAVLAEAEG